MSYGSTSGEQTVVVGCTDIGGGVHTAVTMVTECGLPPPEITTETDHPAKEWCRRGDIEKTSGGRSGVHSGEILRSFGGTFEGHLKVIEGYIQRTSRGHSGKHSEDIHRSSRGTFRGHWGSLRERFRGHLQVIQGYI